MKKILISVFALALTLPAFAQPEKGSITVGGSLDFMSADNLSSFTLAPSVGYFITDNVELGLALKFGSDKFGDLKSSNFGAELYGRYFWSIGDKASFALRGGLGFGSEKEDMEFAGEIFDAKATTFGINVAPEFWFSITPATSIYASVGSLGYNMYKPKDGDSSGIFNLSWNAVGLGVAFNF